MTNEEASEVLKASSIQQLGFCKIVINGKEFSVKEALDMAIETLEQDPCYDDYVSRQAVHDFIKSLPKWCVQSEDGKFINVGLLYDDVMFGIDKLHAPVTPKEKTGHWIKTPKAVMGEGYMWYCNKCEHQVYQDSSRDYPSEKYCPNCGARMV